MGNRKPQVAISNRGRGRRQGEVRDGRGEVRDEVKTKARRRPSLGEG
jgi:hypothetical protein